jgi:hypothetical protein
VQRGQVGGARQPDHDADEGCDAEPRLTERAHGEAISLLLGARTPRLGPPRLGPPRPGTRQQARHDEAADCEQPQPEAEIHASADLALGIDGAAVHDQDIDQAKDHAGRDATREDARKHGPRPPVVNQQQVERQQLGVRRRNERQREEHAGHSASLRMARPPADHRVAELAFCPPAARANLADCAR